MKALFRQTGSLLRETDAHAGSEYAVVLSAVVLAVLGGVLLFGGTIAAAFPGMNITSVDVPKK